MAGERYPCGKRRSADFRSEAQFQRMKEQARLLGLDPLAVTGLLARLAGDVAGLAEVACRAARAGDWAALPAPASPGLDLLAQRHALQEVALFES